MSRGLSKQQQSILGLAYSVRCAFHGGRFVEYPEVIQAPNENWRVSHVLTESDRLPDYQLGIGLHYLTGMPFSNGYTRRGDIIQSNPGIFSHNAESRCAKASLSRAANTLLRKGFLAWQTGEHWYQSGYLLTTTAYEIGINHKIEIDTEDTVAILLGLNTKTNQYQHEWRFKYYDKFIAKIKEGAKQ